jgi:hypothetical protein
MEPPVDFALVVALPPLESVPYGDRVSLALAKDAAAHAFAQAERWKLRCFLAERELVELGHASDAALERLETPALLLELLVDEMEGQLKRVAQTEPMLRNTTLDTEFSTRRLTLALARERAQRQASERALVAERSSHAKTRQLLALAESAVQRVRILAPPNAARASRSEGEPERRRQVAAAEAFASRLQLRRGFDTVRVAAAGAVDVNAALLAWAHGGIARAMRTWGRSNLARLIRAHSSLSGEYSRLREALSIWSRFLRSRSGG